MSDGIDDRIERVRREVAEGREERSHTAPVDSHDQKEHRADVIAGRDRRDDEWRKVMEHHGFRWYEPAELDRFFGKQRYIPRHLDGLTDAHGRPIQNSHLYAERPNPVGQWRRAWAGGMDAFTMDDLWTMFGHQAEFDRWVRAHDLKRRAKASGLVIPG